MITHLVVPVGYASPPLVVWYFWGSIELARDVLAVPVIKIWIMIIGGSGVWMGKRGVRIQK